MEKIIKILLVDDDEEDFIITRDIMDDVGRKNYHMEWVSSFDEATKAIDLKLHDVYLIDYRLGAESGLDLIRNAINKGCKAPLILLTGQSDRETDELAMKAGASDYLVKGSIHPNDLERSIRYSIQNSKNIEEIQKLNTDLEERVKERTAELFEAIKKLEETNKVQQQAEAEVRKALNKERELNELKSKFVTLASHEFRTPLSTVLSSASLISKYNETGDKEKIEKHIQRIKSSVRNLTGILNDFLSLSKLEEGIISNNPTHFNLKELVMEVVEEMQDAVKKDQQVAYKHEGEVEILLDRQIVKNILINLLSNSIKYSDNGKIVIKTAVRSGTIDIMVEDEGIGIPEEDRPFLFSRFFRANNATNIQGTGLGLNIVRRYVELLNGEISFESELKKGTKFFIHLKK